MGRMKGGDDFCQAIALEQNMSAKASGRNDGAQALDRCGKAMDAGRERRSGDFEVSCCSSSKRLAGRRDALKNRALGENPTPTPCACCCELP